MQHYTRKKLANGLSAFMKRYGDSLLGDLRRLLELAERNTEGSERILTQVVGDIGRGEFGAAAGLAETMAARQSDNEDVARGRLVAALCHIAAGDYRRGAAQARLAAEAVGKLENAETSWAKAGFLLLAAAAHKVAGETAEGIACLEAAASTFGSLSREDAELCAGTGAVRFLQAMNILLRSEQKQRAVGAAEEAIKFASSAPKPYDETAAWAWLVIAAARENIEERKQAQQEAKRLFENAGVNCRSVDTQATARKYQRIVKDAFSKGLAAELATVPAPAGKKLAERTSEFLERYTTAILADLRRLLVLAQQEHSGAVRNERKAPKEQAGEELRKVGGFAPGKSVGPGDVPESATDVNRLDGLMISILPEQGLTLRKGEVRTVLITVERKSGRVGAASMTVESSLLEFQQPKLYEPPNRDRALQWETRSQPWTGRAATSSDTQRFFICGGDCVRFAYDVRTAKGGKGQLQCKVSVPEGTYKSSIDVVAEEKDNIAVREQSPQTSIASTAGSSSGPLSQKEERAVLVTSTQIDLSMIPTEKVMLGDQEIKTVFLTVANRSDRQLNGLLTLRSPLLEFQQLSVYQVESPDRLLEWEKRSQPWSRLDTTSGESKRKAFIPGHSTVRYAFQVKASSTGSGHLECALTVNADEAIARLSKDVAVGEGDKNIGEEPKVHLAGSYSTGSETSLRVEIETVQRLSEETKKRIEGRLAAFPPEIATNIRNRMEELYGTKPASQGVRVEQDEMEMLRQGDTQTRKEYLRIREEVSRRWEAFHEAVAQHPAAQVPLADLLGMTISHTPTSPSPGSWSRVKVLCRNTSDCELSDLSVSLQPSQGFVEANDRSQKRNLLPGEVWEPEFQLRIRETKGLDDVGTHFRYKELLEGIKLTASAKATWLGFAKEGSVEDEMRIDLRAESLPPLIGLTRAARSPVTIKRGGTASFDFRIDVTSSQGRLGKVELLSPILLPGEVSPYATWALNWKPYPPEKTVFVEAVKSIEQEKLHLMMIPGLSIAGTEALEAGEGLLDVKDLADSHWLKEFFDQFYAPRQYLEAEIRLSIAPNTPPGEYALSYGAAYSYGYGTQYGQTGVGSNVSGRLIVEVIPLEQVREVTCCP